MQDSRKQRNLLLLVFYATDKGRYSLKGSSVAVARMSSLAHVHPLLEIGLSLIVLPVSVL